MDEQASTSDGGREVIETILGRRSVRAGYEDRPVPADVLDVVLACGLAAPSSKNARPWRFHVIEDRATLRAIAAAAASASGADSWVPHDPATGSPHPHWPSTVLESADVLAQVSCGIVIENRGVFSGGLDVLASADRAALIGSLAGYGFESMGIGAALENLWLAANALGVQVAFLGDLAIAAPDIRAMLGVEGDVVGIVGLGYSTLAPPARRPSPRETQVEDFVVRH